MQSRNPQVTQREGAPMTSTPDSDYETTSGIQWTAFLLICLTYLATTTGEAVLAPIYPLTSDDVGLDLSHAGLTFAILATAIAIFNIVGGLLLRRWATTSILALALTTTSLGGITAATANSPLHFFIAQALLGAGAGLLYPGAIIAIGVFSGQRRRGLAMGIFGTFFSGGMALAAGLSALGTQLNWRWAFGLTSALACLAGIALLFVADAPRANSSGPLFAGLKSALGAPTFVGVIGGISQYATVSFLPIFAVGIWGLSVAKAAGLLAVARVLSIPAKLVSAMAADRYGPLKTVQAMAFILATSGLFWTLSPWVWLAALGAIIFAAEVSALFPLANLLAIDRVGNQGPALGVFRSLQLAAGAVAGVCISIVANATELRTTIAVVALLPLTLFIIRSNH